MNEELTEVAERLKILRINIMESRAVDTPVAWERVMAACDALDDATQELRNEASKKHCDALERAFKAAP